MENNIGEITPRILNRTNPELQRFSEDLAAIERFLSEVEKGFIQSRIEPFFLSTKEVGRILNISVRTLINYRDKGLIPYVKIGGTILYPIDKLKEYLESHMVNPVQGDTNEQSKL